MKGYLGLPGVFTQDGRAMCTAHELIGTVNGRFAITDIEMFDKVCVPRATDEHEAVCICSVPGCGNRIVIREDVACLANLQHGFENMNTDLLHSGATLTMRQTGGMCCALCLCLPEGMEVWVGHDAAAYNMSWLDQEQEEQCYETMAASCTYAEAMSMLQAKYDDWKEGRGQ